MTTDQYIIEVLRPALCDWGRQYRKMVDPGNGWSSICTYTQEWMPSASKGQQYIHIETTAVDEMEKAVSGLGLYKPTAMVTLRIHYVMSSPPEHRAATWNHEMRSIYQDKGQSWKSKDKRTYFRHVRQAERDLLEYYRQ